MVCPVAGWPDHVAIWLYGELAPYSPSMALTSNAGLGVGYFYEKLDIEDWATIDTNGAVLFTPATGEPRLDYLGGLLTGYGNRPYKGSVVHVRLLYLF